MSAELDGAHQIQTLPGMEPEDPVRAVPRPRLTDEQEQAAGRRSESVLVSAAAGSGKTSVLVERFIRAVRDDGIAPGRVLAITFTERAAGELRARVRARLLELGDREAARDTEAAFVGTFHGFCARVLRAHPLTVGLDPDFAIVDEGIAGRLRELAWATALRGFVAGERGDAVNLLAAYGVDRVRSMIEHVFAELRSRGQRRPRLPAAEPAAPADPLLHDAVSACALLDELLERFARAYEQLKRARAEVDFDDLELLTRELLAGREGLRAAWSERFELLMVDEFQDTNPRQLTILDSLDRGNLFTVGDEFQSIYGFRHADVSLFRARRDELARRGASLALTRNFRSPEPMLDVVNAVFAGRFDGYVQLLAGRDTATARPRVELLLTSTRGWEQREDLAREIAEGLPHSQLWRQAEARIMAQRIAELVEGEGVHAGDVAVLLRATGDLEVFERALQLRGLRTLAAVGAFWGHQQIGDLVSYLRALSNPLDEEALYGALASPLGGCTRDGLALLAAAAAESRRGAWATALDALAGEGELLGRLSSADRGALHGFCELLASERANAATRTISELIERAIESTSYRAHVLALDWGERRLANVHKLLRLARRFEAGEGRDLRAFLDHVEYLQGSATVEPDAPVEGVVPDAVRLMTVHAAKGLEFPVVCLADLGRQPNVQTPDLLVDGDRIGVRLLRLDGAGSTPALDYEELCAERRRREAEEEERILYVAMTRARERLLLSGSVDFEQWPRPQQSAIAWLAPAIAQELPALARDAGTPLFDLEVGGAIVRCRLNSAANAGELLRPGTPVPSAPRAAPEPSSPRATGAEHPRPHGPMQPPGGPRPGQAPAAASLQAEAISALSYTSLSELERCGYRYYLERVLGLSEDRTASGRSSTDGGLEARARGTLVHRLMESVDFALPAAPSPQEVAGAARELGLRAKQRECAEIAELISTALRAPPAARVAAARTVRREHPFAFSLGAQEPLITGVIDLLADETDGGHLVLDYKSDRVQPGTDLSELVERDYAVQRLLYALAVLRQGAVSVEIVHWFLERPYESVRTRYTAVERLELEQRLAARLAQARQRPFAVTRRPHRALCQSCPGRVGLCSWGEAETLREHAGELELQPDPS